VHLVQHALCQCCEGRGTLLNGLFAVQMSNLIVFSVTFGSQLMTFRTCSIFVLYILTNFFFHSRNVTKSTHLTASLFFLSHLPTQTSESKGNFSHVSYPSNPNAAVLKDSNMEIYPGECGAFCIPTTNAAASISRRISFNFNTDDSD